MTGIIAQFSELQEFEAVRNGRKRIHVRCKVCKEHEDEAKKLSKNGSVAIAQGVRADGEDRLKLIVDHLQSSIHKAAKSTTAGICLGRKKNQASMVNPNSGFEPLNTLPIQMKLALIKKTAKEGFSSCP